MIKQRPCRFIICSLRRCRKLPFGSEPPLAHYQCYRTGFIGDMMIESRCGVCCTECETKKKAECNGCVAIKKPFWGECEVKSCCESKKIDHCGLCPDFPCVMLRNLGKEQGYDSTPLIAQCKKWCEKTVNTKKNDNTVDMTYETVTIAQKTVAAIKIRMNNNDPSLQTEIDNLWIRFFSGVYENIPHKDGGAVVGIYTNYASDHTGAYDAAAGCAVTSTKDLGADFSVITIPAGKYAKFIVSGPMLTTVAEFWKKIWNMDLPRAYTCDFEEYQEGSTLEHSVIHMYIALK